MTKTYADVDFDAVTKIDELSDIYRQEPYDPVEWPRTGNENPIGILKQYHESTRDNYENAALVFYVDRTQVESNEIVEIKVMRFDEDGNRIAKR